jgi:23S rRNA (uracil1939-C5)-methyltransferase
VQYQPPAKRDVATYHRGVRQLHSDHGRKTAGHGPRIPRIGEQLVLEVTDLTLEGEAIARHGEYVLFVAGAIPGEQIVADVVSTGSRYGRVRVVRVIHRSPARVEPRCRHFGQCGGCSWQHINYSEQLRWKERLLRMTLEHRLPGVHLPILPMIGMPDPWGTRNKAHFLIGQEKGRLALGHYRPHSRDFLPLVECPVHNAIGNRVGRAMLQLLEKHDIPAFVEGGHGGVARHVLVRVSGHTGEAQATLVASRTKLPGVREIGAELAAAESAVSGVHLNLNSEPGTVIFGAKTQKLVGQNRLTEEIAGVQFLISPTSFFQTSATGAARLVETVLKCVPAMTGGPILDLYAGVGLFAAPLARRGHRVVAVEENPTAVEDGIETLKHNRITGCRYLSGKVETTLKKLARDEHFQVAILDPPREGCPEWTLRLLARQMRPQRIIDVSCDPTALATDLALLTQCGYRVMEIQPIDMFPHTAHIESVALLERIAT